MEGRVVQISVKPRSPSRNGLPKFPVESVWISTDGLEGDYNHYRMRKKAGDPKMAVLLYPLEMIKTLNEEGWPVEPGHLGENLTTEGLAYDAFAPGGVYKVGEALLEVTKACQPCNNLAALPYVGKEKKKEFIKTLVDRRGWYARVLREGHVRPGDRVERVDEAS